MKIRPVGTELFHADRQTRRRYKGWNFNSANYLFTTDTK